MNYRKKRPVLLIIISILILAGCSTVKRHASAKYSGDDPSLVDIMLFGYKLYPTEEETISKNLWDLNANAQANLLEILNDRYPDNHSFITALSNEYFPGNKEKSVITDYTKKNLRLVLTINKKRDYSKIGKSTDYGHPAADRIEYLKFSLKLPDSLDLRFTNWNRYTSEYAEIDIADVSFNRSFDLSAEAGISEEDGIIDRSAKAGAKGAISIKEEQNIKSRYLKLNGMISDKKIEIEEEGCREIDLSGNVIVDVSLSFGSFREKIFIPFALFDSSGNANNPQKIALMKADAIVPAVTHTAGPVEAELKLEFVYRHVSKGSNTFHEWDDNVEYYTGSSSKIISLLSAHDYLPYFYTIGLQFPEKKSIMINTAKNKWYSLKFRNYDEALKFHDWLMMYSSTSGNDALVLSGGDELFFDGEQLSKKILRDTEIIIMPFYESIKKP